MGRSIVWEVAIGKYFEIRFPDDWPPNERYEFDWQKLKDEADPFQPLQF
jgi:hypothetical protein